MSCGECPTCIDARERREEVERAELRWWLVTGAGGARGIFLQAFGPLDAAHQAGVRGVLQEGEQAMVSGWGEYMLPAPSFRHRELMAADVEEVMRQVEQALAERRN